MHLSRTNAHFLGGSKALVNAYYGTAQNLGVSVLYEAEATGMEMGEGKFWGATIQSSTRARNTRLLPKLLGSPLGGSSRHGVAEAVMGGGCR